MKDSELQLANELKQDRDIVYNQIREVKMAISGVGKKTYATDFCKEDFDDLRQHLLLECDKWCEAQRAKIDAKFEAI